MSAPRVQLVSSGIVKLNLTYQINWEAFVHPFLKGALYSFMIHINYVPKAANAFTFEVIPSSEDGVTWHSAEGVCHSVGHSADDPSKTL